GKTLNDDRILEDICSPGDAHKLYLYLRDLGPQIGWRTVFLVEYIGPLVIYLIIWLLRQPELRLTFLTPITTLPGKTLNDDRILEDICSPGDAHKLYLYLRDLGPQIGWRTVFLVEYIGPLVIYLIIWLLRQPELRLTFLTPITTLRGLRNLAVACWCGHYSKRLLETIFVHRFSHATMPMRNLFKNCTYYFGFAAFVAYFVNHPLYTSPAFGCKQICFGLGVFLFSEYGNLCCHLALRNLRPPGSTVRRIPQPVSGRFLTRLFTLVACPHYTYEVMSWIGFAIMTQSLPGRLAFCCALRISKTS
ncbi:very-long-chain enoyl-CoA reductase, partial [Paragonimus westermani]